MSIKLFLLLCNSDMPVCEDILQTPHVKGEFCRVSCNGSFKLLGFNLIKFADSHIQYSLLCYPMAGTIHREKK